MHLGEIKIYTKGDYAHFWRNKKVFGHGWAEGTGMICTVGDGN